MSEKRLIERDEILWGSKIIVNYKITEKGKDFCKMVLDPYEKRCFQEIKRKKMNNIVN